MVSRLNREQKEAVGLLSVGTFLEYFDLMLYIHMAVLLNELFFPKTDPQTASLLTAFAFCSTFVFRPIGALLFGWIGDNFGRKATIIITTSLMSISCIIIAILPTYAEMGIMVAWILTICRIMQGMSSMGELVGVQLYLTEITNPPIQYPAVTLISIFGTLGGTCALSVAAFSTSFSFNWRIAFWIGAVIALFGSIARTRLRETPDFADPKRRVRNNFVEANKDIKILTKNPVWMEKVNNKTALALVSVQCLWPVCFYFVFIYCGSILKSSFNYSTGQIMYHNLIVSMIYLLGLMVVTYLSYKIYPLKILKVISVVFFIFVLICPYLLNNLRTPLDVFLIQAFVVLFRPDLEPAVPIFFKHFPVFKRFTYASLAHALSRAIMYIITSFGLVYLTEIWGYWGLLIIMIPASLAYGFGILYFEKLEMEVGNYPQKKIFVDDAMKVVLAQ